mmetsp:Transcript_50865/g.76051  ORF Transcript_50865/g.76051 Transcript_50865/m.76051 type:complete len:195 (-) Transcript_50865:90-674(-)
MASSNQLLVAWATTILLLAWNPAESFDHVKSSAVRSTASRRLRFGTPRSTSMFTVPTNPPASALLMSSSDDSSFLLSESDQAVVGIFGTVAALIMMYSEFTLKTTGCGLPAGPFGLLGLAEGLSYLTVIAIGGLSLFKKLRTGSGLPAGPAGSLGAAEGLSFLAVGLGIVVLGFQLTDYGYVPNAVPVEGGICS